MEVNRPASLGMFELRRSMEIAFEAWKELCCMFYEDGMHFLFIPISLRGSTSLRGSSSLRLEPRG